jgi:hypothetical protein
LCLEEQGLASERLEFPNDLLQQLEGAPELLAVIFGERGEGCSQRFDAALAALPHQADTFGRCFQSHAAAIFGGVAAEQSRALEAGDDAAHSRWSDLLGIGKFAKRSGATEDQNGERGELGGTDAAFAVADAELPEQVNGDGVQLIGDVRLRANGRQEFSQAGFFDSSRGTALGWVQAVGSHSGSRRWSGVQFRGGGRSARRQDRTADGRRRGFSGGVVFALDRRHRR